MSYDAQVKEIEKKLNSYLLPGQSLLDLPKRGLGYYSPSSFARGLGWTTSQMQAAPKGSIYVTGQKDYAWRLAKLMPRRDLYIVIPSELIRLRQGRSVSIVIDHAVNLEIGEYNFLLSMRGIILCADPKHLP